MSLTSRVVDRWVRSLNFPIMFALALRPVLGRAPVFFFFSLYAFVLLRFHPYDKKMSNIVNGILSLLNALHGFSYGLADGSTEERVFMVLIVLAAGALALMYSKRKEQMEALWKRVEEQAGRLRPALSSKKEALPPLETELSVVRQREEEED